MKRIAGMVLAFGILLPLAAQAQSLEEQLRSQLRDARSQLQDLQNEQAALQAKQAAAAAERDQARKALEQAQAELARLRAGASGNGPALAAERQARQRAEEGAEQSRHAAAEAATKLQEQQTHGTALASRLEQTQTALNTCGTKNLQLYQVGKDILDAYVHMDVGTLLSARQPFAAAARTRLENAAQAYGDRLYEQRYVPVDGKQP
jgi:chromosome segregation ATPase